MRVGWLVWLGVASLAWSCTITEGSSDDDEGGAGGTSSGEPCENVDADGLCEGDELVFCNDGLEQRLDCAVVGEACRVQAGRADCGPVARDTACSELTPLGDCQGDTIRWCDETRIMAVPVQYDCGVYGQECDPTAASDGGAICVSHGACPAGLDEAGECDGNTLRYCQDDELFVFDCGVDECRVVADLADCFTAGALAGCGTETADGRCDGSEAVRCQGNTVTREDCAAIGLECVEGTPTGCQPASECPVSCAAGYSCSAGRCTAPTDAERAWTVAVYMVGDNNLADAAWQDLNEMEMVGSSADVQVVAELELSNEYTSAAPEAYRAGAYRLAVEADSDPNVVTSLDAAEELGDVDMTDPAELAAFARWAAETYPSQRFALILWDHGFGWRGGFVDSRSSGVMSLRDVVDGVLDSGVSPDLLAFDACLMGMHEVGMALRGVTDTLVASEEVEPGGGYPYDAVLERLSAAPDASPTAFGNAIAEEYAAYFDTGLRARSVTMSVLDLRELEAVNAELASFSEAFLADLPGRRSDVQNVIRSTDLLRFRERDSVDLYSMLEVFEAAGGLMGTSAGGFRTFLDGSALVASNQATRNVADAWGLALHLPATAFSVYSSNSLEDYRERTSFLPLEPWHSVLANLTEVDTGPSSEGVDGFRIQLSWADAPDGTASNLDLDLVVVEPNGEEAVAALGSVSSNGLLSADSADSGLPLESYELRQPHQAGTYVVLVHLFLPEGAEASDEQAFPRIELTLDDAQPVTRLRGRTENRAIVEVPMDASNPLAGTITSDNIQQVLDLEFSTLWYVTSIQVR